MEPVFIKKEEEILYLVSGNKEGLGKVCQENCSLLDSSRAEGAGEKHIPVAEKNGNKIKVSVGSIFHPMTEEHSIAWVFLETKLGGQFIRLQPGKEPVCEFAISEKDEAIAVYAYCNLHGFWRTEI